MQKYERTMSDEDEEDDEIGADVVSIAHFGGGKEAEKEEEQISERAAKRYASPTDIFLWSRVFRVFYFMLLFGFYFVFLFLNFHFINCAQFLQKVDFSG